MNHKDKEKIEFLKYILSWIFLKIDQFQSKLHNLSMGYNLTF